MRHRKELARSPIEYLYIMQTFVIGLLALQLFDSLVFVFSPLGLSIKNCKKFESCNICK